MTRYILLITALLMVVIFFSFSIKPYTTPSQKVKTSYLAGLNGYINELKALQLAIDSGNKKQIQTQFLQSRNSYKKIEAVIEYYYDSYAINLNGPPIPFFEENEPYKLETEPLGMQVIEGLIFPEYDSKNKPALKYQLNINLQIIIQLKYAEVQ